MNNVDLCTLALNSGCKPVWADGILGRRWHCGCEDGLHCMNVQCSVITPATLQRKRHVRPENPVKIVVECAKCGHLFDICRNGFRCDACDHVGVRGARYADTESTVVELEPKAAKDVALLETWFKLEDQRS